MVSLIGGVQKAKLQIFGCINEFVPVTVGFNLWHGFFVVLGILILLWPRPIFPLTLGLLILSSELYINFMTNSYTTASMLLFILVLVTLALIIYHSRPQFR
jgi:hypothetical protein